MAVISETIELLGKGLYANIPDQLTLKSIPTASELDYVGSEDFEKVMLESILPQSIEEDIPVKDLLEILHRQCLKYWMRSKIVLLEIISWNCHLI